MTSNSTLDPTTIYRYCAGIYDPGYVTKLTRFDRKAPDGIWVTVTEQLNANWRGDDRDVYDHITCWYRLRLATESEISLAEQYSRTIKAWQEILASVGMQQSRFGPGTIDRVDSDGIHTKPLRLNDSDDDRTDTSSKTIPLTPEQFAAYNEFILARDAFQALQTAACEALDD